MSKIFLIAALAFTVSAAQAIPRIGANLIQNEKMPVVVNVVYENGKLCKDREVNVTLTQLEKGISETVSTKSGKIAFNVDKLDRCRVEVSENSGQTPWGYYGFKDFFGFKLVNNNNVAVVIKDTY